MDYGIDPYSDKLYASFEEYEQAHPQLQKTLGTIKAAFNRVCGHVKADEHLARRIIDFQVSFVNKNEEHMAFFGGNLTGVQVVRFTAQDMDRFFTDVMQINDLELEDELHALPSIVATRHVSGDVFNHTCLWAVHILLTSNLPEVLKQRAAQSASLILLYRYLTSLLSHYYRFPADPQVAAAAYAQLSGKFAIKQHGSWHAVLEARTQDLIGKHGLHYQTTTEFEQDDKIVYALNDTQGRIRDMMKNLIAELKQVAAAGTRIRATSATVELDGESFLRDKTKNLSAYTRYLHSIVTDEHAFIKGEILEVLAQAIHTAPPPLVHATLLWCTTNYRRSQAKEIEELIDLTIVHSFSYLQDNRTVLRDTNDLPSLIIRLKGVYMSSRSQDVHLMKMRELAEKITTKAIKTKNPSIIAAVKTSLMLYLVVRAFTMAHYGAGR